MTDIQYYSVHDFDKGVTIICEDIRNWIYRTYQCTPCEHYDFIFPVVRGGTTLAVTLSNILSIPICEPNDPISVNRNILVVDDIIDSGKTRIHYKDYDFVSLHSKINPSLILNSSTAWTHTSKILSKDVWIQYWWEDNSDKDIEDTVVRQLQFIGEDPDREGLKETPSRVVQSWKELYGGYEVDIEALMTVFTVSKIDQMILVKDIDVISTCEHHILPFIGKAHVAYIPSNDEKIDFDKSSLSPLGPRGLDIVKTKGMSTIIGISKIYKIVDAFSRRLQIQERIGEQVCDALMEYLKPKGCACIIKAEHLCVSCRGVKQPHSSMVTSALRGVFTEGGVKEEMINLIKL